MRDRRTLKSGLDSILHLNSYLNPPPAPTTKPMEGEPVVKLNQMAWTSGKDNQ